MSLDKAIAAGKEKRKEWRNSKSFDSSCRNHGGCPYCENGRTRWRRLVREIEVAELGEIWCEDII